MTATAAGRDPDAAVSGSRPARRFAALLPLAALAAILAGLVLYAGDADPALARRLWLAALALTGLPLVLRTLAGMLRGHFASDVVATLAILAAIALQQPLAGLVVVLMQSGGEALERFAEGRASRAVRELEAAAPRVAHRLVDGRVQDVAAEAVRVGDLILVRPGERIPCDAVVVDGRSHVDQSSITGEPLPVRAVEGAALLSGSLNQEGPLTLRVTALAAESQYARIVQLVRSAQASKAPLQRLADRYAVWFTPLTLAVCLVAWLASRDPLRVLAVLVVATPCPLILATPVAIIGGIDRAARLGIIFRTGAALEQLGRVRVAVFDKTGTITIGHPEVAAVHPVPPFTATELLRLAGAVEDRSGHLLARSLVSAAHAAGVVPPHASDVIESPGRGVSGRVEGRTVTVGAAGFLRERHPAWHPPAGPGDGLRAHVAVDGRAAGSVEYADQLRPNLRQALAALAGEGVARTLLLSGDASANARAVADTAGIVEARGDLLPEGKVEVIRRIRSAGEHVLMVGDGTNDAPALVAADVGVALAAHGGGVTAEAADVVLLADDLGLVAESVRISRRTLRIARQSIWVGLGLSGTAMIVAAAGHIPPTVGALLQEAIDVLVILNALRAAAPGGMPAAAAPPPAPASVPAAA